MTRLNSVVDPTTLSRLCIMSIDAHYSFDAMQTIMIFHRCIVMSSLMQSCFISYYLYHSIQFYKFLSNYQKRIDYSEFD